MKTEELIGPTLDWAVAQANNTPLCASFECGLFIVEYREGCGRNADYSQYVKWTPSTDWSQGGPIIEREGCFPSRYFGCAENSSDKYQAGNGLVWMRGPSPLIAAMRCFVASVYGESIDLPEGPL